MALKQNNIRGMNPRVNNGDRRTCNIQQVCISDPSIQYAFAINILTQEMTAKREDKKCIYNTTLSDQPDLSFTFGKSNAPSEDSTVIALDISLQECRMARNGHLGRKRNIGAESLMVTLSC